jgi:hypothetical protein
LGSENYYYLIELNYGQTRIYRADNFYDGFNPWAGFLEENAFFMVSSDIFLRSLE